MSDRPKFQDSPGIRVRHRGRGWEARWVPRTDLVNRGYSKRCWQIWVGVEPSDEDRAFVAETCGRLQGEMIGWGRGLTHIIPAYSGTLKSLADAYLSDPASPYKTKRYKTRIFYERLVGMIVRDYGSMNLSAINARLVLNWHGQWSRGGKKISMGHAMVGMLRTLINFGMTLLEDKQCERLSLVLSKMKFKMAKPRSERLTAEQAIAIRAKAHEMGFPSMALGQALQFELMLRQKDVIGEWIPIEEPGMSPYTRRHFKWMTGIQWQEIDEHLVLRHTTSKRQKDIEVQLPLAPMVMEELARTGRKASGAIIISERTGLPYVDHDYRHQWRAIADACGIPRSVRNMDSRAGGISEATDAGADLEHVRHAATHSDIAMTQKYSRGSTDKVAKVMELRTAHRAKNKAGNDQ
jgi:hypothetical protein